MTNIVPWQPQPNNIYHMDALTLLRHMPDNSVDLIVTDPPYGVTNAVKSNVQTMRVAVSSLNKHDADTVTFDLNELMLELLRVAKQWVYIFGSTEQIGVWRGIVSKQGYTSRLGFYQKINPPTFNGQYIWLNATEMMLIVRMGSGAVFNRFCQAPIFKYPIGSAKEHPTQKPVRLIEELIESSSNPNALILDPFIGSGTTAVAAQRLGRQYIGCDISAEYVEIARRRVQNSDPYKDTITDNGMIQKSLFAEVK